ncbi:MAG: SAM-dependent methyltransferase [Elusimicrobia bacterium]|nr:SAM-dependent methyltransferase [Elusimicrobiota bacterium]
MTTDTTASKRTLFLVPWHIGNRLDITVHAARVARNMRVFLTEEPALTRRQFESDLGIDCQGKEFLLIPEKEDPKFLKEVLAKMRTEDAALICSGGIPCFIDPGAWLVKSLRERDMPIRALAGASILSTMLSLSAMDWTGTHNRGTFIIYLASGPKGGVHASLLEAVRREDEPVFIFLALNQFKECIANIEPVVGKRLVSAFFDLTKKTKGKYPYADRVITLTCREWLKEAERMPWKEISDVALMVHPSEAAS